MSRLRTRSRCSFVREPPVVPVRAEAGSTERSRQSPTPESAVEDARHRLNLYFFAGDVTDTVNASVHVMSTRSPTLTFARAALSSTRDEYVHFTFSPLNVIDGTLLSMATIAAVIVRCVAAVAAGLAPLPLVTLSDVVSTAASPAGFTRSVMLS